AGVLIGSILTSTTTDALGDTSEFSQNVAVPFAVAPTAPTPTATATPGPATIALDSFSRTVTSGWGAAQIGGTYALEAPSRPDTDYNVNGSNGTVLTSAVNQWHSAYLTNVTAQNIEFSMRVQTDKVASGGFLFSYFVTRRNGSGTGTEYLGRLAFSS